MPSRFPRSDVFAPRHLGPRDDEIARMLEALGLSSLDELVEAALPDVIRTSDPLDVPPARGEQQVLRDLRELADRNEVFRSYLGLGYHACITPGVIQRNILENPGWYTQYTPYQAEISQGRLEMLLNFQTMVIDLTGLDGRERVAAGRGHRGGRGDDADQALAAEERSRRRSSSRRSCHPQTIDVVRTRAAALGIEIDRHRPPRRGTSGPRCSVRWFSTPRPMAAIHDESGVLREASTTRAARSSWRRICWRSR